MSVWVKGGGGAKVTNLVQSTYYGLYQVNFQLSPKRNLKYASKTMTKYISITYTVSTYDRQHKLINTGVYGKRTVGVSQ